METVPQELRYAGYWWDRELGWYWVSVRDYDPGLKRWLQPDPSGAEGWQTYAYVSDDPVDAVDPSGLAIVCDPIRVGRLVDPNCSYIPDRSTSSAPPSMGSSIYQGGAVAWKFGSGMVGWDFHLAGTGAHAVVQGAVNTVAAIDTPDVGNYPAYNTPSASGMYQTAPLEGNTVSLSNETRLTLPNALYAQHGNRNVKNHIYKMAAEQIQGTNMDPCAILEGMLSEAKNTKEERAIITAGKAFGCRNIQKRERR